MPVPEDVSKQRGLLTSKAIVWAEIKSYQQEYERLQKQVDELEQAKKDIVFKIQDKVQKAQDIADKLLEIEYETLKAYNI